MLYYDYSPTILTNFEVHDASALDIYLDECRRRKVVPNTQITRQLGNYQLQLRHNYLKDAEVAALTSALKVGMARHGRGSYLILCHSIQKAHRKRQNVAARFHFSFLSDTHDGFVQYLSN